eukprot:COSAG06_NODE_36978_length_440_cov_14.507331_1_plen_99_part_10
MRNAAPIMCILYAHAATHTLHAEAHSTRPRGTIRTLLKSASPSIHVCVCVCVCVCATVYLFIRIIFIYLFIYMHTQGALPPMMLTVGNVHDIHHDGGTV